jgi:hypothetical protein
MTGFISGPIAEAGSETMNVLGLHAAQHHFRRHARQRFVARLLGKANSFSRWRGITTACADIIHTRTRRMFALLLATHRGKKSGIQIFHIKSQANDLFFWEILFLVVIFSLQLTLLSKKRRQSWPLHDRAATVS